MIVNFALNLLAVFALIGNGFSRINRSLGWCSYAVLTLCICFDPMPLTFVQAIADEMWMWRSCFRLLLVSEVSGIILALWVLTAVKSILLLAPLRYFCFPLFHSFRVLGVDLSMEHLKDLHETQWQKVMGPEEECRFSRYLMGRWH